MRRKKGTSSWIKGLLSLLISGGFMFLLLSIVVFDLKSANTVNSKVGVAPPPITNINESQLSVFTEAAHYKKIKMFAEISPGDMAALMDEKLVDRLGLLDIFILVFIWPVGLVFGSFSRIIARDVRKWVIKSKEMKNEAQ
jgi:hypothetical protein